MARASRLMDAADGVGTLTGETASCAVAARGTVVILDPDPKARRLNADALRRAGYSVIELADREQLLDLVTDDAAIGCLVVAEGFVPTRARWLVAEARSVRRDLRTILWELDRPSGTGQVCESVAQLLVDAEPSRRKIRPLAVRKGDRILFTKYAGTEIQFEGDDQLIIREDDVLAFLE